MADGSDGRTDGAHLKSLADYPPVQGGKPFDGFSVDEQFINKPRQ